MRLTMTAGIHARWGHRVDGLIHTHAWSVEATVTGPPDCDMVIPADDLEDLLAAVVEPWTGHYLTQDDVGPWKAYQPLLCEREPTVEELTRQIWQALDGRVEGLTEVALTESSEFDRSRRVTLSR